MTTDQTAEPTKTRPGDQQLPAGGRECVQDALIALIEERKQLGIQRYGSPLMTHNGRDSVRDATEEALDLTVYLMQVAMEMRDLRAERDTLTAAAKVALTALEGADTTCRYHGENPPKAPAWHGGCESCQQPTRVREALAAIRALTTEENPHA